MAAAWTVKDSNGQLIDRFVAPSRIEVGRKVVPTRYDAFRLQVSASYRELFDRALAGVLERERWQIVRVNSRGNPLRRPQHAPTRAGNQGEVRAAALS
jgi:hypothetical protein